MKQFGKFLLVVTLCSLWLVNFANVGKVTFINGAQQSGWVHAVIHYANGTCDSVKGTVWHPSGTSAATKGWQLVDDINQQCVGADASNGAPGTAVIFSGEESEITEIIIIDNTNQKKTINPSNLHDNKVKIAMRIEGFGSCIDGSAYLSMDNCGEAITVLTYEKTGEQVANELASGINNCLAGAGTTIISYGMGGGEVGVIEFLNLPAESSIITFDAGGDCGFSDIVSMSTNPEAIPTLSQWGVIILLLLVLTVGMVFLYQRQSSLAISGVAEASSAKPKLFDRKLFAKVFAVVLLIGLAGLVAAYLYYGQITNTDPFGTVVSAGIVAYMAHLWLMRKANG